MCVCVFCRASDRLIRLYRFYYKFHSICRTEGMWQISNNRNNICEPMFDWQGSRRILRLLITNWIIAIGTRKKKRAKTNCKTNNNLELAIEWKIAAVNSLLKEGLTYLDSKVDNGNNKNSDKLKNRKFNYDFLCVTITSLLSYAERKRKEENAVFNKSIFLFLPWWSSLCSLI